ncbi:MAG: hypothetical protein ACXWKA_12360 [Xanthobacteraceae bacterium]
MLVPFPKPSSHDIADIQGPIADRIWAIPATTFAGLAAKAIVARTTLSTNDWTWEDDAVKALTDAVFALADKTA